ncbi:hypothetical protein [Marinilactibacillus kalidii]|uniref:hypothetical protein n=1 Tax=Marinilactibacillus kalidii TaxID=2820274 RepID=UPI001ABECB6B|nr:hypothetical protein [Marinilactibacillus kalidii]
MNKYQANHKETTENVKSSKGGKIKRSYQYARARSNKRSSKVIDTFKLRKTGNSVVISVPEDVLNALSAKPGDDIQFITVNIDKENRSEETVLLSKVNESNSPKADEGLDSILDDYFDKYDSVMKSLVDK